ncbi:MAG: paraquat-inducible protein A, partial [Pseudomonadales bacterium]|nr:paraquat-inducible protein A [Pseudomonadales bacterium]
MNHNQTEQLVACPECDRLYRWLDIPPDAKASCSRCRVELYRHVPDSLTRSLAWYVTAFMFLCIANLMPFLSMSAVGLERRNLMMSGALALAEFGMPELGVLVFCTSIGFPLLTIAGMLWLLIPACFGRLAWGAEFCYRWVHHLSPWSLLGVFMLGTLIAFVKLQDLAAVSPGPGLFAFAGMLLAYTAGRAAFSPEVFWSLKKVSRRRSVGGPHIRCHICGLVLAHGDHHCPRCESRVHHREQGSLEKTAALTLAAAIMFIPANLFPIMMVSKLGQGHPDTILSGVISLMQGGMFGLALIVLFASIIVPLLKLVVLTFLIYTVHKGVRWRPRDRTLLYRLTEVVGAWSMVDIFLVGLLSGL